MGKPTRFGAGALASSAFVNTQLGAAAAMLAWLIAERAKFGNGTTVGAATGAVAGLASREGVEVVGMDAAAISYPGFAADLAALGA